MPSTRRTRGLQPRESAAAARSPASISSSARRPRNTPLPFRCPVLSSSSRARAMRCRRAARAPSASAQAARISVINAIALDAVPTRDRRGLGCPVAGHLDVAEQHRAIRRRHAGVRHLVRILEPIGPLDCVAADALGFGAAVEVAEVLGHRRAGEGSARPGNSAGGSPPAWPRARCGRCGRRARSRHACARRSPSRRSRRAPRAASRDSLAALVRCSATRVAAGTSERKRW